MAEVKLCTVSPLHTNLRVVNFQRYEYMLHVQSNKLVHLSGVHCRLCADSTSGGAFACFIAQYNSTMSLFQAHPGCPVKTAVL